jgi:hypothetical protein
VTKARDVLRVIDGTLEALDHHPALVAHHARRGSTVQQLLRAFARYKTQPPAATSSRPFHDDVEPIDPATLERYARESEEHHRGRRLRLNTLDLDRRRQMTGLQLAQRVIDEAKRISTVPAGNVEPTRATGATGGLPRQQRFEDDPRWQLADRMIHRQALILMELIDEARGFSRSAAVAALSAEDKDKAIRDEGAGLKAEDVFMRLGPEYGSISYIRRKRREWGLDTRGHEKPDDPRAG